MKSKNIELLAPAGLSAKARNKTKTSLGNENLPKRKNKTIELLAPAGLPRQSY